MDLTHEISIAWAWFKMTAMNRMQDALTFFPLWAGVLMNTTLQLVFFKSVYLNAQTIGGWSFAEVVILLGNLRIIQGVAWGLWVRGGFRRLPAAIEYGVFDTHLIRPMNLRIQFIFNNADFISMAQDLIVGSLLILYGLSVSQALVNWLMYFVILVLALSLHYSLTCLVSSVNFWTIVPQLSYFMDELFGLGQYPSSIYKGAVKWILTLVVPLACIYSFPPRALMGSLSMVELVTMVAVTAAFWFMASGIWRLGLKRYESAQG